MYPVEEKDERCEDGRRGHLISASFSASKGRRHQEISSGWSIISATISSSSALINGRIIELLYYSSDPLHKAFIDVAKQTKGIHILKRERRRR